MKAWISIKDAEHHRQAATWLCEGLERHGIEAEINRFGSFGPCDFVAIWGWRQKRTIEAAVAAGVPILVMERGHLHPRAEWISLGWNGLANRATYPGSLDSGERFEKHFGHLMQPWRPKHGNAALIISQIRGDPSLNGIDIKQWATERTAELVALGYERIIYRQHPLVRDKGHTWRPRGTKRSEETLEQDFTDASLAVSYSSTAGIQAVLSGLPHVAYDEGSMAWTVSSHSDASIVLRPDRTAWTHALAWTQWKPEEIREGKAWEALHTCIALSARAF